MQPADATTARSSVRVNRALWSYSLLVVITTAWAWILYYARLRSLPQYRSFFYRPLFMQSDRFSDLTLYRYKISHLSDGAAALAQGLPVYNYPAPAAYVYAFFLAFQSNAVMAYLVFAVLCVFGSAIIARRAIAARRPNRLAAATAIATTAVLGYPLWFAVDRGNLEVVVWALSAAGLCLLLRARYLSAAVLLGMACAVKPFPVLFFLLLLRRRKFKEAAVGVAVAILLTVTALAALGPNPWQAYRELQPGIQRYMAAQGANLGHATEARVEHSLLDGLKSAAVIAKTRSLHPTTAEDEYETLIRRPGGWPAAKKLTHIYPFIAGISLALMVAVYFRTPLLNQLTAAGVAVTLLPLVSSDYTLLHLYVPFGAFIVFLVREAATGRGGLRPTPMAALAVIYALLFAPLSFLRIFAGDAKLLLLLALLFVVARWPMPSEYFGDPPLTAP